MRYLREIHGEDDSEEDDDDCVLACAFEEMVSIRYHEPRGSYRKADYNVFKEELGFLFGDEETEGTARPWLNDDEFRQKYRMSKESFRELYELIKDDRVFKPKRRGKKGRQQAHPAFQLAVLLKYYGTEGSGNSNPELRNNFRIGRGTAKLWRDRALKAVRRLGKQAYTWPDADERAEIAHRIEKEFDWPNCVGIMDGTLFPLAFEPELPDSPDYHGRKYAYSITCLVICDDQRRIRYILCGWPGSTHDERVWRKTKIYKAPESFMTRIQYLLGDTAYENDWFIVSSYKKPAHGTMPYDQELFNDAMKRLRVVSEHTIGILKGRFPMLRSIRMKITDPKRDSVTIINRYIEGAVILHNLLLQHNDEIPEDWIADDDASAFDDPTRGMTEEEMAKFHLNAPIPDGAPKGERRTQLKGYHNTRRVMFQHRRTTSGSSFDSADSVM